jgi:hypothetical protein
MAQIKMDVSEYEEMKKNAKLLEASLQREKDNSDEISRLKELQIETLKLNKKKVTIVKVNRTDGYVVNKRPNNEIIDLLKRGSTSHRFPSIDHKLDWITNAFFDISEIHNIRSNETVTTEGLEEYIEKIEVDLKDKTDKNTKRKLERLAILEKSNESHSTDIEILNIKIKSLQDYVSNLEISNRKLENFESKYVDVAWKIGEPYGLFDKGDRLNALKLLIKTQKDESKGCN